MVINVKWRKTLRWCSRTRSIDEGEDKGRQGSRASKRKESKIPPTQRAVDFGRVPTAQFHSICFGAPTINHIGARLICIELTGLRPLKGASDQMESLNCGMWYMRELGEGKG